MLTKDSVTVWVDAVLYYSIFDPLKSIMNVEDVRNSTKLLAQSCLRNAISTKSLSQLLTDRTQIIQQVLVSIHLMYTFHSFYFTISFSPFKYIYLKLSLYYSLTFFLFPLIFSFLIYFLFISDFFLSIYFSLF